MFEFFFELLVESNRFVQITVANGIEIARNDAKRFVDKIEIGDAWIATKATDTVQNGISVDNRSIE